MPVSVILPTLNEAGCIAPAIAALRSQHAHQIIVVDAGSTDGTPQLATGADLVLASPPGRAVQMNTGAAHATGDVLLFLHADCVLEDGALAAVEHTLRGRRVVAGCFRMEVSAPGLAYRLIDACATARVRLTGLAYGDQGLCIRRDDFARLGGFPPMRFMEDVFFSRKLRKLGRVAVIPRRISVSPRRWQKVGILRQTLRNWSLLTLAALGVPPDHLATYYPKVG